MDVVPVSAVLETQDGMDLDIEDSLVQIAVVDYAGRTLMADVQLTITVQHFLNQLKEKMQIPDPQRVRLVFGGVTMTETLTLSSSGVAPGDTAQLHMCLAGGMQGASGAPISSLIPFRGEGQKEDEEMAQSPNLVSGSW